MKRKKNRKTYVKKHIGPERLPKFASIVRNWMVWFHFSCLEFENYLYGIRCSLFVPVQLQIYLWQSETSIPFTKSNQLNFDLIETNCLCKVYHHAFLDTYYLQLIVVAASCFFFHQRRTNADCINERCIHFICGSLLFLLCWFVVFYLPRHITDLIQSVPQIKWHLKRYVLH